jgi:hypothetical protein
MRGKPFEGCHDPFARRRIPDGECFRVVSAHLTHGTLFMRYPLAARRRRSQAWTPQAVYTGLEFCRGAKCLTGGNVALCSSIDDDEPLPAVSALCSEFSNHLLQHWSDSSQISHGLMRPGPWLGIEAPHYCNHFEGEQASVSGHDGGPLTPLLLVMVASYRSI